MNDSKTKPNNKHQTNKLKLNVFTLDQVLSNIISVNTSPPGFVSSQSVSQ